MNLKELNIYIFYIDNKYIILKSEQSFVCEYSTIIY